MNASDSIHLNVDLRGPATDALMHLIETGLAQAVGEQLGKGIAAGMLVEPRTPAELAAPDMLEALKALLVKAVEWASAQDSESPEVVAALAAITKAGG